MSKRKNPSSRDGQDVVNLLTKEDQANANNISGSITKEATSDAQANAKTIEPTSKSSERVTTENVQHGESSEANAKEKSTPIEKDQQDTNRKETLPSEISSASSSNEKQVEKGKKTIEIDDSYKRLLGKDPANATDSQITPSIIVTQQMKDLDMTMEKATEAVLAGRKEEAAFLFRIHEQMKNLSAKESKSNDDKPTNQNKSTHQKQVIVIDDDKLKPPEDSISISLRNHEIIKPTKVENGFTFREGASTNSDSNAGLTPYFEKNIKELRLPVPLTIFNEEWQEEAWQYHAEKKVKSDDSTKAQNLYSGHPYPHEFSQSYMSWAINYRNFIKTIRHKFKFKTLADWLEAHKENVENIRQTECWMVAFRYDLKMRTLLFTEKVTYEDGTTGPVDISKERVKVREVCFAKARKCDELSFTDNPYAEGGERFEWDHNTGTQKNRQTFSRNSSYNSTYSNNSNYSNNTTYSNNPKPNYNTISQNKSQTKQPFINQKNQNENKKRSRYAGNNFDPNYVRKDKEHEHPVASTSKQ